MPNLAVGRSLSLLNEMGDLTITWEADRDDEMAQIIEKKMKQGIRFFIVKPFTGEHVRIKTLSDISSRTISVPDEDVEKLFTEGKIGIIKRITGSIHDTIKVATSAMEVAKSHSIGVKQFSGG